MLVGRIEGATRVMGERQAEYHGLPIRDERMDVPGVGDCPAMRSAWFPTPAEMERLLSGAPIYLVVLGVGHPPVTLEVGDPPEAEAWTTCPICGELVSGPGKPCKCGATPPGNPPKPKGARTPWS